MNKIKAVSEIIAALALLILFIIYPKPMADSISSSINTCLTVIIPSMFVFMVLSSYIISKKLYNVFITPLHRLLKPLIRMDKEQFTVFILSLIGGYPTGIKLLQEKTSENKNYHEISAVMSVFSYCVSPVFAVNIIGYGIYGCAEAGIIVYISNVLACFITAVFCSRRIKSVPDNTSYNSQKGIIYSINSASKALLMISAIIIYFNAVLAVTESLFCEFGITLSPFITGSAEISNLIKLESPSPEMLPLISFISSFGGICVLLQCASISGKSFSLKYFLIGRVVCGILSLIITHIIMSFWEITVKTSSGSSAYIYTLNQDKTVVILLIMMCTIIFLKSEKIFKKL